MGLIKFENVEINNQTYIVYNYNNKMIVAKNNEGLYNENNMPAEYLEISGEVYNTLPNLDDESLKKVLYSFFIQFETIFGQ